MKKLKTYNSSLFIGQNYFGNYGSQNFLIFQPIYKTFKMLAGLADTIAKWESKGLSNKKNKPLTTANHSLSSELRWMNNSRIKVEFKGSCLKQAK